MPIKTIIDIKDMPGYNPAVKNGIDSVSTGRVFLRVDHVPSLRKTKSGTTAAMVPNSKLLGGPGYAWPTFGLGPGTPWCADHGAMLRVSKDGIWRCGELGCDNGCYATH